MFAYSRLRTRGGEVRWVICRFDRCDKVRLVGMFGGEGKRGVVRRMLGMDVDVAQGEESVTSVVVL